MTAESREALDPMLTILSPASSKNGTGTRANPKKATSADRNKVLSFNWHEPGLFIEFTNYGDPFHERPGDPPQLGTIERREYQSLITRGRLASYAEQTFSHQHRTHLFQLLVLGNEIRFIRWDRAGASVSGKFNYVEDPRPLKLFLHVYGRMSEIERGWDATVSAATALECTQFSTACATWLLSFYPNTAARTVWGSTPAMDITMALDAHWPAYKVALNPRDEEDSIIIKRPFHTRQGEMIGKGTRRYLAYSRKLNRLVIFKDCWRVDDSVSFAEATAYSILKRYNVASVPEIYASGDVAGNVTRMHELVGSVIGQSPKRRNIVITHPIRQHRILQDVNCPLVCLQKIRDVMYVMQTCHYGMCPSPLYHNDKVLKLSVCF